jgi:hypothetical protein
MLIATMSVSPLLLTYRNRCNVRSTEKGCPIGGMLRLAIGAGSILHFYNVIESMGWRQD